MDEFIMGLKSKFAENFMEHKGTNTETKPHTMSFKTICEVINGYLIEYQTNINKK